MESKVDFDRRSFDQMELKSELVANVTIEVMQVVLAAPHSEGRASSRHVAVRLGTCCEALCPEFPKFGSFTAPKKAKQRLEIDR